MTKTRRNIELTILLGVASCALYFASAAQRGGNRSSFCQSNLKQIGLGLKQYERDYDEKTVLSENWRPALWPYTKSHQIFECPIANGYAHNRHLSGVEMAQVEDYTGTPTVFDSLSTQPNASDFGASYPKSGAHEIWRRGRGTNVLFFDGHVEWLQTKPAFRALTPLAPPKTKKKSPKTRILPGKTSAAR